MHTGFSCRFTRVLRARTCMCMNVDLCLGRLEGSEKGSELSRDWFSHLADLKISLSLSPSVSLVHARLTDSRVSRRCLISSYRSVARLKPLLRKETRVRVRVCRTRAECFYINTFYIYIKMNETLNSRGSKLFSDLLTLKKFINY